MRIERYTTITPLYFNTYENTLLCKNANNCKQHRYNANTSVCENVVLQKVKYVARVNETDILQIRQSWYALSSKYSDIY